MLRTARELQQQAVAAHRLAREARIQAAQNAVPGLRELDREIRVLFFGALKTLDRAVMHEASVKSAQLQKTREELLLQNSIDPRTLDETPLCPICRDSLIHGDRYCACVDAQNRAIHRKKLAAVLDIRTFAEWDSAIAKHPVSFGFDQIARDQLLANRFALEQTIFPKNILLMGAGGTGKTALAACLADLALKTGQSVGYIPFSLAVRIWNDGRFGRTTEAERRRLADARNADVLIIDNLGEEVQSAASAPLLVELLDERRRRSTVVITQLYEGVFRNAYVRQITEQYDKCVASRLCGVDFTTYSFRNNYDLRRPGQEVSL